MSLKITLKFIKYLKKKFILKKKWLKFNSNKLYLRHSSGDNADEIFRNGFWAEIVSEYIQTQEEIDRVINYLKNK